MFKEIAFGGSIEENNLPQRRERERERGTKRSLISEAEGMSNTSERCAAGVKVTEPSAI